MRDPREIGIDTSTLRMRGSRFSGHLFMVLVAVVCGVAGAFGAIAFRLLIHVFQDAFFGGFEALSGLLEGGSFLTGDDPLATAVTLPWYRKLLAPALGGLLVGPLVYYLAREAKGHGVPEVMESVALRGGTIRPRVVAVKALASALSIGSGGSVGREGPIVQIGSALSSTIGQILRVPSRQLRTIVGCGTAAGIAATFNAPIAGALFAVEVILGDFAVPQFSPIVIASVVATVISRHFLGDFPAFVVPPYELVSPFELFPYMFVGVIAGIVAVLFVTALYATEDGFERIRFPAPLKAALGGLLVGAIGIGFPQVFGVGYTTINGALTGALPAATLGFLLLAKIVATSITIGSGGSGGVFAPSLFMGAVTGGFLGTFVHQWFPEATASSGSYALVTMGAVVAATTHAPITAIIMIFELTGNYTIIPALMTACVVSTLVASFLKRDSVYTLKLRRRGIDLSPDEDPNVLHNVFVRDIVDREPAVVPLSANFDTVLELIVGTDHTEIFVVNEAEDLVGAIYFREVRRVLLEQEELRHVVVAGDLVERSRPTVTEDDRLDLVIRIFSHSVVEEIAVVDRDNPRRLVGSLHKREVLAAYNQEILRRDLAGGVLGTMTAVRKVQRLDLGDGYVLQELLAPTAFHGRDLSELNLRRHLGIQVLLLRRLPKDGVSSVRVPTPDDRILAGDRMVVAGPRDAVARLEDL
jgi:CIC family chloride channel protein